MRTLQFFLVGIALSWTASGADLKIGVLDLQRAMTEYYRAKQVENQLLDLHVSFEKEFQGLKLEGEKRVKEAEHLRELSLESALSETARQEKQKEYEAKVLDLRAFEVKYDAFQREGQMQLQEKRSRLTKGLLEDIVKVTYDLGEKEGFNLILNASKANPATSDVLFAKNVEDVTPKVISTLNARRPLEQEAPPGPK